MKAQTKRHIRSTDQFDHLIPPSIARDTVVVGGGNATLSDTVVLMQDIIKTTLEDTKALAKHLKGNAIEQSCQQIWDFVFQHIQYKMDATGIEQVRRPSRSWTDRLSGVDCDCYTVFIGSILMNLGIPFKMRITKYNNRKQFQHVYPIVPTKNGYITMDCVADSFNYEVPFSEKKDVSVAQQSKSITEIGTLSGVDELAIGFDGLEQPILPLRTLILTENKSTNCVLPIVRDKKVTPKRAGKILSPFRFTQQKGMKTIPATPKDDWLTWIVVSGVTVMAGLGIWQLFSTPKNNTNTLKK